MIESTVDALVREILKSSDLPANDVAQIKKGEDEFLFSVNDDYILRLSSRDVQGHFAKLTRGACLDLALKVRACANLGRRSPRL